MLIEHEWHAYNTRRFGNPWAARISFNGVKPVYDFVGRFASGRLAFEAEPGDLMAMGQKDHRGNGTTKEFYLIGAAGELERINEAHALLLWRERTTATTPDNGADNEMARLRADHERLKAALEKIVAIQGSTGGPASMVAEFKFIAEQALAVEADRR